MIGLEDVIETFSFMMLISAIVVFVVLAIRFLPEVKTERKDSIFDRMRLIAILLPIVYVFLNIDGDVNSISDFLFDTAIPLVLVMILAFGIIELGIPFLEQVKRYTSSEGSRAKRQAQRVFKRR